MCPGDGSGGGALSCIVDDLARAELGTHSDAALGAQLFALTETWPGWKTSGCAGWSASTVGASENTPDCGRAVSG